MRKHRIAFLLGCFVGSWLPFAVDQLMAYQDRFGILNLNLGERVTLISLSPDENMRVLLVELGGPQLERNFELRLQKRNEGLKTIFTSSDEEKPAGAERIVWSSDSSQFILLGRKSKGTDAEKAAFALRNGEWLDLLYDVRAEKLYTRCFGGYRCVPIPEDTLRNFQQQGLL